MLRCSTSLWSADLANLASEIRRVEPHSERFHLDVADGHYVPALLFFPDLVAAIRKHTTVPFEVHLLGSLNVGLFCDMREHRRGIGRFVAGRTVLNTFAYTGALSVAAARAGAKTVTSVDLSSGVLAWARENFRLSGFAEGDARLRFVTSDVRRFTPPDAKV